jgi:hypothetical protein
MDILEQLARYKGSAVIMDDINAAKQEIETLRARVAELEKDAAWVKARVAEKVGDMVKTLRDDVESCSVGPVTVLEAADLLEALAHTQARYNLMAEKANARIAELEKK